MTNHPHRPPRVEPPDIPALLFDLRTRAGLTQQQCADMALAGLRTWKHWEAGDRAMPLAALELWCLALVAGNHMQPGKWCEPWVRRDFRRVFCNMQNLV